LPKLEDDKKDARWHGAQVKGRQTKDGLEISLGIVTILKIHHLDFVVSDFHSCLSHRSNIKLLGE